MSDEEALREHREAAEAEALQLREDWKRAERANSYQRGRIKRLSEAMREIDAALAQAASEGRFVAEIEVDLHELIRDVVDDND